MSSRRDLAFHHIGVACERIADEVAIWEALGYRAEGEPFIDVEQEIESLFMVGSGPRIELLEAYGGSGTLAPWIKRRVKLYHLGFLAVEFDAALAELASGGAKTTREPVNSSIFQVANRVRDAAEPDPDRVD